MWRARASVVRQVSRLLLFPEDRDAMLTAVKHAEPDAAMNIALCAFGLRLARKDRSGDDAEAV
jgi:hypothetical protein